MDFLKYYLKNSSRLLFPLSKNWLKALWENLSTTTFFTCWWKYISFSWRQRVCMATIFVFFLGFPRFIRTSAPAMILNSLTYTLQTYQSYFLSLHFDEKFPVHLTEITKPIQLIHFFVNTQINSLLNPI